MSDSGGQPISTIINAHNCLLSDITRDEELCFQFLRFYAFS
jgi:hypothetical protein